MTGVLLNPYMHGAGAPPPAFDPGSITTWHSLMWAENPAQALVDGTQYAQWDDMSGNNRHVSDRGLGVQYHPVFRSSVAALNNKPAFEFDGVDDFFATTTLYTLVNQTYSIACIGAATDRLTGEIQAFFGGSTSANRHDLFYFSDNVLYSNAGTSLAGGAADTTKHLFIAEFNGQTSKLWKDGVQVGSGAAGSHRSSGLFVGSIYNIQFPLDGYIAMVGLKSAVFTVGERDALLAGAQSHYGTP